MSNIYVALLGDLGSLAQSQQQSALYRQYSLAQQQDMQVQALQAQQAREYNAYAFNAATIPGLQNIGNRKFVPITQEEVDMAEAWYEVDKIAPGIRSEK